MWRVLIAWAVLVGGASAGLAAVPDAVMGPWWTQDRDGVVTIYPCATGVCGRVTGVTGPDANPLDVDGRPRCQLQIIPGGRVNADGVWDAHITNPDDDRTYTITLQVDGDGRLRMRGYIGIPLFGKTVFWTRFTGHLTKDCHITP